MTDATTDDLLDVFGEDIDLSGVDGIGSPSDFDNVDISQGLDDLGLDEIIGFEPDRANSSPPKKNWDEIDAHEQKDFLSWLDEEPSSKSSDPPPPPQKVSSSSSSPVVKTMETKNTSLTTTWDTSEGGFFHQLQNELSKATGEFIKPLLYRECNS